MNDEILSQDEIDALAAGVLPDTQMNQLAPDVEKIILELEKVIAKQIETILATTLALEVTCQPAGHSSFQFDSIASALGDGAVAINSPFLQGLNGNMQFFFTKDDVAMIADLMLMGEGTTEFLPEHIDAIGEAFNQVNGSLVTKLNAILSKPVQIGQVDVREITVDDLTMGLEMNAVVNYHLVVADKLDSVFFVLFDPAFLSSWNRLKGGGAAGAVSAAPTAAPGSARGGASAQAASSPDRVSAEERMTVKEPDMPHFHRESRAEGRHLPTNIEMLLDISLPLTIELGRTNMMIRDILELGHGSIVELDKLAGEPVDVLVNEKVIARGEVVVIDENFGVRITSLVGMEERIKSLR